MLKTLVFLSVLVVHAICNPCEPVESLDITNGTLFPNGSIVHEGLEYGSGSWYEAEENNGTVTLGCPCLARICLWKCCGRGQVLSGRICVDTALSEAYSFSPPVFKDTEVLIEKAHQHFFYMYNKKLCTMRYLVNTAYDDEFVYIQQNGDLMESVGGNVQWHKPARFCVDLMMNGNATQLVAAPCHPTTSVVQDDDRSLYIMYGVGLLFSTPFLLVTLLVYGFVPELRNLHGLCLMAYCAGMLVAYPFLAYLKMQTGVISAGKAACIVIAFIVYYAFQTSFFWLNVMCFDIWQTFRGYRGGSSKKRQERRRFALYGAYAWGVPLLLTALVAFMQFGGLPSYIMKPGFGDMRCWFQDWKRELLYFYSPVLILVLCNTVLFSVTACRIRSIKQETAILKSSESARSDRLMKDKQRYGLYLKLFIVMGVNWTLELVTFAVGGSNWYWIVVDLSNVMLGFFIFLILVWKRKVRNLIRKRWNSVRGARSATDSMGKWATRTSSAPTEDTRVSSDESALRMKELH